MKMRIYIRNIKSRAASVSNHKDINKYDTGRHTKTGQILGYFNPRQTLRLSGKIETENQSKNHDSNLPILIQPKLQLFWIILLFKPRCHNVLKLISMMTPYCPLISTFVCKNLWGRRCCQTAADSNF